MERDGGEPPPPHHRASRAADEAETVPLQHSPRKSYAQMVLGNTKQVKVSIPIKNPSFTDQGEPAVFFSKAEIQSSQQCLRFAIIAKCSYGRPAIPDLKICLTQRMALTLDFVISKLNQRHLLLRFGSEADFLKLMLQQNLYIKGYLFRFFRWTPDFAYDTDPASTPVWLGFPGLPVYLYHEDSMKSIAGNFGTVLRIHDKTVAMTDTSEALACVELDLAVPRRERLWIDLDGVGFWQKVTYHRVPQLCSFCYKLGHSADECKKKLGYRDTGIDGGGTEPQKVMKEYRPRQNVVPSVRQESSMKHMLSEPINQEFSPKGTPAAEGQSTGFIAPLRKEAPTLHSGAEEVNSQEGRPISEAHHLLDPNPTKAPVLSPFLGAESCGAPAGCAKDGVYYWIKDKGCAIDNRSSPARNPPLDTTDSYAPSLASGSAALATALTAALILPKHPGKFCSGGTVAPPTRDIAGPSHISVEACAFCNAQPVDAQLPEQTTSVNATPKDPPPVCDSTQGRVPLPDGLIVSLVCGFTANSKGLVATSSCSVVPTECADGAVAVSQLIVEGVDAPVVEDSGGTEAPIIRFSLSSLEQDRLTCFAALRAMRDELNAHPLFSRPEYLSRARSSATAAVLASSPLVEDGPSSKCAPSEIDGPMDEQDTEIDAPFQLVRNKRKNRRRPKHLELYDVRI